MLVTVTILYFCLINHHVHALALVRTLHRHFTVNNQYLVCVINERNMLHVFFGMKTNPTQVEIGGM